MADNGQCKPFKQIKGRPNGRFKLNNKEKTFQILRTGLQNS